MKRPQKAAGVVQQRRTRSVAALGWFPALCRAHGLPEPIGEYQFHPTRKWRIDWCWPLHRVGLEIDGAVWVNGRHTRGAGWLKDTEKMNTLASMGYRMFRTTPTTVADVLPFLEQVLR